jgi:hypothetical protein
MPALPTAALLSALVVSTAGAFTRMDGPFDDSGASYSLVTNGGMEAHAGSVMSSWTDATGGLQGYDSRAAYSGSGSMGLLDQAWVNAGAGVASYQNVSVSHGSWYVLSGYIYNDAIGGGNAYLDLADASYTQADGGSGDCSSVSSTGHGDWQFVHCEFYVPNGTHSVRVRTVTDGSYSAGSYVWFDEVALTPSASFTPPESLSEDGDGDGYSELDGDCDDHDASSSPGATEYCDGVDNDCDGSVDEDSAADAGTWYADSDGDSYGDAASVTTACSRPSGHLADSSDCDDGDATINPGAVESCDGVDNDCDGSVDEDDAIDTSAWYADVDGDGYGDPSSSLAACSAPSGMTADGSDCDDSDATTNPGADERCDGHDDDCDGAVDEDDAVDAGTWHSDSDGDGFGDLSSAAVACSAPSGMIGDGSDCDDHNSAVFPGADERCNGYDDDCDGAVDEADAVDAGTWYADSDGDGYGDPGAPLVGCTQPPNSSGDASDCDDGAASVYPGAPELWYDGIDQDCDGASDYDADADGWDHSAYGGDDCDDEDAEVNPDAHEVWYDGVDQDCDGHSDYDWDWDDHDSESYGGDDCDDSDFSVYPGAPDDPYDGVITDCDASDEYDADGDGHDAQAYGGDDCDDAASGVHPGADEIWYDGIDQDCDGNDDDQDGDGWPLDQDCDDTDPGLHEDCEPEPDTGDTGETDIPPDDTGETDVTPDDSDLPFGPDRYMGGGGLRCSSGRAAGAGWCLLGLLALLGLRRRSGSSR